MQARAPGLESGYAVPPAEKQREANEKAYPAGVPPTELWQPARYARMLPEFFDCLRRTPGDDVVLIYDVRERVTPSRALAPAKAQEPYKPFFLEEPVMPEHIDTLRPIRQQAATPQAAGEV